jgi:uncharacterized protein YbjT (DUF2867 family)
MKPILVTGASGLFGGEVARQLVALGIPVRIYVRDSQRAPQFDAPVEVVVGDYLDSAALAEAISGVDKMFLASYDSTDAVSHQANVLAVAGQSDVQHIVRLSADGTDENTGIPIIEWHRLCERQLEDSGITYTHLQPGWIMQNFESFVVEDCIRLPAGDGRIGLVDHRDVAAVGVAALTEAGHENLGHTLYTESLSHAEVAEILTQATGRSIRYLDIDPDVYQQELEAADWERESIDSMLGLFAEMRAGGNDDRDASDMVVDILGRPGIRFSRYARDYAALIGQASSS